MKLRRAWISGLALCLVLTACAPATRAPTRTPAAVASAVPSATASPTTEAIGSGVPVIDYTNGGSVLTVISTVTGRALDGLPGIPLGTYYNYTFSPDGSTLAVTSRLIYLIDLRSWKSRTSDVGLHGWVSSVVYSPDGSLLALASGGPEGYLQIVNAQRARCRRAARLASPSGISSSRRMAKLSWHTAHSWQAQASLLMLA